MFWDIWDRLEAIPQVSIPTHQEVRHVAGKPVYFHYLTLMALHCYMEEKVGTAVIECGIGGEYDTTNILSKPLTTGVTSLGIDHEALLGRTIESIAWHKAGIFKQMVPAFTVPQPMAAMKVLKERAKERRTKLYVIPEHQYLHNVKLGLKGDFQRINASLAIAISATHLSRLGYSGMPDPLDSASDLPSEFIVGLESARLGGRCDERADSRLSNLTWYIDGGHTLDSIEMAVRWFASTIPENTPKILIFNQQTRNAAALVHHLHQTLVTMLGKNQPFEHAIFCTNTTYKSSGYKPDLVSINTNEEDVGSLRVQRELAHVYHQIEPRSEIHVLSTIEESVNKARELAGSRSTGVLVTGSLHLVGGLIEILESESQR